MDSTQKVIVQVFCFTFANYLHTRIHVCCPDAVVLQPKHITNFQIHAQTGLSKYPPEVQLMHNTCLWIRFMY